MGQILKSSLTIAGGLVIAAGAGFAGIEVSDAERTYPSEATQEEFIEQCASTLDISAETGPLANVCLRFAGINNGSLFGAPLHIEVDAQNGVERYIFDLPDRKTFQESATVTIIPNSEQKERRKQSNRDTFGLTFVLSGLAVTGLHDFLKKHRERKSIRKDALAIN